MKKKNRYSMKQREMLKYKQGLTDASISPLMLGYIRIWLLFFNLLVPILVLLLLLSLLPLCVFRLAAHMCFVFALFSVLFTMVNSISHFIRALVLFGPLIFFVSPTSISSGLLGLFCSLSHKLWTKFIKCDIYQSLSLYFQFFK